MGWHHHGRHLVRYRLLRRVSKHLRHRAGLSGIIFGDSFQEWMPGINLGCHSLRARCDRMGGMSLQIGGVTAGLVVVVLAVVFGVAAFTYVVVSLIANRRRK